MELSNARNTNLYVAFMDYEKAFDFMNRAVLIKKMINKKMGRRFIDAVNNMYLMTTYTPKISNSRLGETIDTRHGVTQGKKSSANFYSMYVSDMADHLKQFNTNYMDPHNLAQLADDTATFSSDIETLKLKILALLTYSDKNFQKANIGKTKYLHLSCDPYIEPLSIDEKRKIESAHKDGYRYLGMLFIIFNKISEHISKNLKDRMGNIHKFYAWLENNIDTPIKVKLLTLYNCVFSAILYGAETWGDMDKNKEMILQIERKALKRCLGVKSSTPNELIYIELNRANMISALKDRQYKFFLKLTKLNENEALVKSIMKICGDLDIIKFYQSLQGNNRSIDIEKRKLDTRNSIETMTKRYVELTNNEYCYDVYESYIREDLRTIITRWRLSSHDLKIERGRYLNISREERLCLFCDDCIEDENHALFYCNAYTNQRRRFSSLLEKNFSLRLLMNPTKNKEGAIELGMYLKSIEEIRKAM